MKSAIPTASGLGNTVLLSCGVGLVAVVALAAALVSRSAVPDTAFHMAGHRVVFPDGTALTVQKHEVTVAQWHACYSAGACVLQLRAAPHPSDATWPATGLSHADATQYLAWVNARTRQKFRLPTLQEWEFIAATVRPPDPDPIFTDPDLSWASAYLLAPHVSRTLLPQGAFSTTPQGISDLNGSVWEWTSSCYAGVNTDATTTNHCPAYFVGGDHVAAMPYLVCDPARGGCAVGTPPAHLGMRLVSDKY